jgi:hypothetical protein
VSTMPIQIARIAKVCAGCCRGPRIRCRTRTPQRMPTGGASTAATTEAMASTSMRRSGVRTRGCSPVMGDILPKMDLFVTSWNGATGQAILLRVKLTHQ